MLVRGQAGLCTLVIFGIVSHALSNLVLPSVRECCDVPSAAHGECFDWYHVVLVSRCITGCCGMAGGIYNTQFRLLRASKQEGVQLVVREQQWVRAVVVGIEVDYMAP